LSAGHSRTPVSATFDWSHIFIDVLSALPLGSPEEESHVAASLRAAAASITARASGALCKAAVAQWEVKFRVPSTAGAWRVVVSVPSGHEGGEECVEIYREACIGALAPHDQGNVVYKTIGDGLGSLDGASIATPYAPLATLQQKRLAARRHNTTYCYDFPAVFEHALREAWAARAAAGEPNAVPPSGRLVHAQELVVAPGEVLTFKTSTALVPVE
jgi:acetyl-CoA carboxylase / biotin carboxylase 1